jgi:predicted XRE-type DNA-binding protein
MARIKMEKSSGNIFRDIGFSREESASLLIRADLMITLSQLIKKRKLTQAEAARLLGVTQPRISNLVGGKIELFSIDTLIDMIHRAGGTVKVTVRRAAKAA